MSTPAQTASEAPANDSAASNEPHKAIKAGANAVSPADAWLASLLSAGPVKVCEITTAAQAAGMSMRTVERAKRRLGIKADRSGKGWCWSLPQDRHEAKAQGVQETTSAAPPATTEPPAAAPAPSGPAGPPLWTLALVRSRYGPVVPLLPFMVRR
jgi:hypothetical protein